MEDFPKVEFKKQFNDKASTDLVIVEVPSITIDKVIDASVNTKVSHINMSTQVNHKKD